MEISGELIGKVLRIAFIAGKAIMDIYQHPFEVEYKSDNSPVTIADETAHKIIAKGLSETGLPILSEEGAQTSYEIRENWKEFWLVDPLDGTKEFIKKNGDFTVNIALISNMQPIFGVVYAPVPGFIYWGSEFGSFRLNLNQISDIDFENFPSLETLAEKLPCISRPEGYLVLGSRSHMNSETESYISNLKIAHPDLSFISRGSSLKFCTLAEGGADVYPRFGPTMEWDTAAGHAVARFAGCSVNQFENGLVVEYNKHSLLNPNFIALSKKK
ncbi:MAG: 3'(2'),5'-bisphosphate nucleotidase CysQ [Bacteroidales bacterium]|nr:3'(2'),5'-bisphosphate nucleotidase CysQ [Bacteroidales bacterium]